MENLIIILFLVIVVLIGLKSTMKHFKGQGGCCGGSEVVQAEPKVLDHVLAKKVVTIEGMHCNHCKKWVEESINEIDGASAVVDLAKKQAIVSMEKEISDQAIGNAVVKAGYKVVKIEKIEKD